MVVKLIVASGKNAGRAIAIKRNKLLIGRAEECDVRPLSEEVSRRHCAVHVGPGEVFVEDLGSRNGTFVNGDRIAGKIKVVGGDMIRVGALELKVSCSDPVLRGSEDDVSRWLLADEAPAGMFDTTQSLRPVSPSGLQAAGRDVGEADAGSIHSTAEVNAASGVMEGSVASSTVSGISSIAGSDAGSQVTVGSKSGSSLAMEAVKESKARPGGLPKVAAGKSTDSSRDAAAEALKKFFGNR